MRERFLLDRVMAMSIETKNLPTVSVPADVSAWYESKFLKPSFCGQFLSGFGAPLRDPKIFAVLKPRPIYRFAAIDAWRRMMWRPGGLPRRTREAIAVAVSIANQCLY